MGCTVSAEEAARRAADKAIEREQRERAEAEGSSVKLLLLGAGESGKSTLFKQFRELYGTSLTVSEREQFRPSVYANVLDFMHALCTHTLALEAAREAASTCTKVGSESRPENPTPSPKAVSEVTSALQARGLAEMDLERENQTKSPTGYKSPLAAVAPTIGHSHGTVTDANANSNPDIDRCITHSSCSSRSSSESSASDTNESSSSAAAAALKAIEAASPHEPLQQDLIDSIRAAWADDAVQEAWSQRADFQIIESSKEFVTGDTLVRLADPGYVPSTTDIMRCRVRTSGIVEERYTIDGVNFSMYDVGGQRNERKKWIHCFEGVTAVIFVAAISEYDQTLFEADSVNRMVEALDLFEEICGIPYFVDSSIILFLNKCDLFAEKVRNVPIAEQEPFRDFDGGDNYDAGVAYFTDKFLERSHDPDKQIFHHVTCALDSANVRVVFDSCKETIMRQNLADMGMM